jgi:hypothetical protein
MSLYPPYGGPKRRPGLALARKNQALFAERFHWPDGALEACRKLEDRFPGWYVSWLPENTIAGFERPAGFWAVHDGSMHRVEALRPTARELAKVMADGPPEHDYSLRGCDWCLDHLGAGRVKL